MQIRVKKVVGRWIYSNFTPEIRCSIISVGVRTLLENTAAPIYSRRVGQRRVMNGAAGERSSRAQQTDNCENGAHQNAGGRGAEQVSSRS